ncbi:hypothetical protein RhiJN_11879 [Ceratobasidium sp. AG-Ba]|nr:hypothetical protein RhiJN_11879 [Ceratobasidium sp. AG-Ba]
MSQRSSSRVTRSQSAQGESLVPPVDNPDWLSVARSDNATSLSALREQVLQMTTEATDAIHAWVSIPGSYADPDETIQAEPTIIVGEGNPNESTATAADIIGGRSIPRTTVESVSDPDESRLSEDIGRTPDTTEPVATQVETAQTTGPEHFWNARASISPGGIISVRRRVPVDPTAGIEDQIDPVPPYAPNPLELPTGKYGPTNIPREERHLYSAHPLTGVRTRSQASNAIEAPIPQRLRMSGENPNARIPAFRRLYSGIFSRASAGAGAGIGQSGSDSGRESAGFSQISAAKPAHSRTSQRGRKAAKGCERQNEVAQIPPQLHA